MGFAVCGNAMCACTFGTTPSAMQVLPTSRVVSSMPIACIMDYIPMVNIMPFGMCNTLSNPMVASATAAALGVLTPMPCIPVTTAPWAPGSPTVFVGGKPALNHSSKLMCMYGGVIQINNPGISNIQVP